MAFYLNPNYTIWNYNFRQVTKFTELRTPCTYTFLNMVYKHDLRQLKELYRPETWLTLSAWHHSCKEIISKYDVLQVMVCIYDFDFHLKCAESGLQNVLLHLEKDVSGAQYVINEIWKNVSLHVINFKYCNSKCCWSICYKHDTKFHE